MSSAAEIFAQTPLYTDHKLYRLIQGHPRAITAAAGILAEIGDPFSALIVDKDEVTLLLPDEEWQMFAHRLPDHQSGGVYRLITFDQVLEPDLVGFMAVITQVLADAQVSILALSAFARDHLLVSDAQFGAAWTALTRASRRPPGR